MKLLLFEAKKFFKNTKNLVLIGLMFILITIICIQKSNQLTGEREDIYINDSHIYLELMSISEESEKEFPELITNFQQAMSAIDSKLKHSNKKEWRTSLEQENNFIDNVVIIQKKVPLSFISTDILQNKKKNNFYLEHNIKPDNSLYGVSAMYYIRLILSQCFSIYGYLFFLLLFFDLFSREIENKNKNWLMTLPVPYKLFNRSKLVLATLLIIGLSVSFLMSVFILGLVLSKTVGTINYPMEITTVGKEITSLPFSIYLSVSFCIFIFVIYFLLLLLLSLTRIKLESEKVLLITIISLTATSQFTKLLAVYPSFLLMVNYINLHQAVIDFFKQNLLIANFYTMGFCIFFLILLTAYLFRKTEN